MTLSRNILILLAAAGSAAVLLGAFGFQFLGDLPPCKLCIWQRWPHAAAVVIVVAIAVFPETPLKRLRRPVKSTISVFGNSLLDTLSY